MHQHLIRDSRRVGNLQSWIETLMYSPQVILCHQHTSHVRSSGTSQSCSIEQIIIELVPSRIIRREELINFIVHLGSPGVMIDMIFEVFLRSLEGIVV